jgi:hypothetical protein
MFLCGDKSKKHFFYLQDSDEIIVEVRENVVIGQMIDKG